jgi:transcriptional regulator with XRE-family HTH domain
MSANHPLRSWREKHGLTAEELGDKIGVSKAAVSRYERGHRRPDWPILSRIAEVTKGKITADDFLSTSEVSE